MQLSPIDSQGNIKLIRDLSHKVYPDNQVLADITFVQAILEAGLRKAPPSLLALKYNNLFGIKGQGTKGSVTLSTKENIFLSTEEYDKRIKAGEVFKVLQVRLKGYMIEITVPQQFASNSSIEDSLVQHKALLDRPRYQAVAEARTFEVAAQALKDAGYATDISYPQKLIDIYKQYVNGES